MRTIVTLFLFGISLSLSAQNHAEEVKDIASLDEAMAYAKQYREVSVTMIDEIKDRFFFEELDTIDPKSNLGKTFSNFGRVSKIVKDTLVDMIEIELIQFDLDKTSESSCEILLSQMRKRLEAGATYWETKEKFGHTSAYFYSGPKILTELHLVSEGLIDVESTEWQYYESGLFRGMIRVKSVLRGIQGYYVLGFNEN